MAATTLAPRSIASNLDAEAFGSLHSHYSVLTEHSEHDTII